MGCALTNREGKTSGDDEGHTEEGSGDAKREETVADRRERYLPFRELKKGDEDEERRWNRCDK